MNGLLIITLEPASIAFYHDGDKYGQRRNCTVDEIRKLLLDLHGLDPCQNWPLRDCEILLRGKYSQAELNAYGLERAV